MNGATADPWVSTMSPPNSTRISTIGSSQNFLRSRMNAHNSTAKSPISFLPSELSQHVRGRPRLAPYPICLPGALELPAHGVVTDEPHQQAERCDDDVEDHPEDDPRIDPRE